MNIDDRLRAAGDALREGNATHRLFLALRDYTIASQACRREAAP
jgi:hypothetical protein